MDFVNGEGRLEPVFARALREPIRVMPTISVEIGNDGAGVGAHFGTESVGIGFEGKHVVVGADDFEFIDRTFIKFGNENLPDARRAARAHGMDPAVPMIEIADNADAASAGRPDGKVDAANAFQGNEMSAKLLVGVVVAALAHEIQIKLGKEAGESVGVVDLKRFAMIGAALNFVAAGCR